MRRQSAAPIGRIWSVGATIAGSWSVTAQEFPATASGILRNQIRTAAEIASRRFPTRLRSGWTGAVTMNITTSS